MTLIIVIAEVPLKRWRCFQSVNKQIPAGQSSVAIWRYAESRRISAGCNTI